MLLANQKEDFDYDQKKQCNNVFTPHLKAAEFPERYKKYRKAMNEVERLSRLVALEDGERVKKASEYSDSDFEEMMFNTYGPLDKNGENYSILFEGYKSSKLEQLANWEEEEAAAVLPTAKTVDVLKMLMSIPDLYDEDELDMYFEEEVPVKPMFEDIAMEFNYFRLVQAKCELETAKAACREEGLEMDPSKNKLKLDWLILPRPFPKERFACPSPDTEEPASNSDLSIVNCFRSDFKKSPYYQKIPHSISYNEKLLLLPNLYMESESVFHAERALWHQLLILIQTKDGKLRLADLLQEFEKTFGYSFNIIIQEWQFYDTSIHQFLERMNKKYNNPQFFIFSKTVDYNRKTKEPIHEKFLLLCPLGQTLLGKFPEVVTDDFDPEPLNKVIQNYITDSEIDSVDKARAEAFAIKLQNIPISIIPQGFVQLGEAPPMISDMIIDDSYLRCMPFWVVNPSYFTVILSEYWDPGEINQEILQARIKSLLFEEKLNMKVNPSLLVPGLILLAKCYEPYFEWYRVRIVSVKTNPFEAIVFMIDHGPIETITDANNMLYMTADILESYQQQSIECKLIFNELEDQTIYPDWTPEAITRFDEMLKEKSLGIKFVRRIQKQNTKKNTWMNKQVWLVSVNILEDGNGAGHSSDLSKTDIDNPFLHHSITTELQRRRKRKKKTISNTLTATVGLPNFQLAFETQIEKMVAHGEPLCTTAIEDISQYFKDGMILRP